MKNKILLSIFVSLLLLSRISHSVPLSEDSGTLDIGNPLTGNVNLPGTVETTTTTTTTTTVTTTTTPGGGGGGGGIEPATTVAVTTIPVITTTLPPVEEVEIVESIEAGETGTFTYEEPGLDVTEISVEVKNAVSNAQITLTKTDTAPATVAIQAPGYTYMYLTVEKENIEDEDISRVTIKFKVKKSWISDNNIDRSTITMMRYSDGTWSDLPTTEMSEDAIYLYFEAESPGLSVFSVTGEKLVVTTTTLPIVTTTTVPVIPPVVRGVEWYFVLILFVIVFLVLLVYNKYGQRKFKKPYKFFKRKEKEKKK